MLSALVRPFVTGEEAVEAQDVGIVVAGIKCDIGADRFSAVAQIVPCTEQITSRKRRMAGDLRRDPSLYINDWNALLHFLHFGGDIFRAWNESFLAGLGF